MEHSIDYYLALPYTIRLTPDKDGTWFVDVAELPGCMSVGNDPRDAIDMIRDAMRGWLEVALEDGIPVPEPRPPEAYSGKFVARVPRSLHRELAEAAEREGVSLNQFVSTALARAVGERAGARAASTAAQPLPYLAVSPRPSAARLAEPEPTLAEEDPAVGS